ncbi:MAG: tetratricopeptide repeat protein, partial [Rhodospirillales bacterium]|nr:tetratricopeptide repeat protein [Rhodospirillales bacterium]
LPKDVATTEQLYLIGVHIEQYRHATREPQPYYEEALRRDPTDVRNNNALGLLLYRRGLFGEAEPYFRRAIQTLTGRNPNPYDGEPYYNLGLCLRMQGRFDEAYESFYKATWNAAQRNASFFELARIACRRRAFKETVDLAARALASNRDHHQVRHVMIAAMRRLGWLEEADRAADEAMALDAFNFGALLERAFVAETRPETVDAETAQQILLQRTRGNVHNHIELALDCAHAGLLDEAERALAMLDVPSDAMAIYYRGWIAQQAGRGEDARQWFEQAAAASPDYCFPNRLECVPALKAAIHANANDARAPYYLGLFYYANRAHERAIALWERARELDSNFPTVHRNLGLA